MHPDLTCILKQPERPVPFKVRNYEPKGGGCAFEAPPPCFVTR